MLKLLCFHAELNNFEILFKPEPKSNLINKKTRLWNIKALKLKLGVECCKSIIFPYRILGFNTAFHLFGIGKRHDVNKLLNSANFRGCAELFTKPNNEIKEVLVAGERALVNNYGGTKSETLDNLSKEIFYEKVVTDTLNLFKLKELHQHLYQLIFIVSEYLTKCKNELEQTTWIPQIGAPYQTDMPPIPSSLMKIIHCKCKTSCGNKCGC